MNVADKIILVTGGANGIGKALCERFFTDGAARIYVADIDLANAEKVAESVGGKAFKLDVADEANCKQVVKEILDEAGRLDFIASNAGIGGAEGLLEVSNDDWRNIFEINVLSHFSGSCGISRDDEQRRRSIYDYGFGGGTFDASDGRVVFGDETRGGCAGGKYVARILRERDLRFVPLSAGRDYTAD
jgi:NAD(P)-dependent dehydrogenase (short-subunit alcohol dehydrogenase family)